MLNEDSLATSEEKKKIPNSPFKDINTNILLCVLNYLYWLIILYITHIH